MLFTTPPAVSSISAIPNCRVSAPLISRDGFHLRRSKHRIPNISSPDQLSRCCTDPQEYALFEKGPKQCWKGSRTAAPPTAWKSVSMSFQPPASNIDKGFEARIDVSGERAA